MLIPGAAYSTSIMQDAATATGNGLAVPLVDAFMGAAAYLTLQVTGITTAAIVIEGTINQTNWVAIEGVNLNNSAPATTITANGLYRVQVVGLSAARARISSYGAGTITVVGMIVT